MHWPMYQKWTLLTADWSAIQMCLSSSIHFLLSGVVAASDTQFACVSSAAMPVYAPILEILYEAQGLLCMELTPRHTMQAVPGPNFAHTPPPQTLP